MVFIYLFFLYFTIDWGHPGEGHIEFVFVSLEDSSLLQVNIQYTSTCWSDIGKAWKSHSGKKGEKRWTEGGRGLLRVQFKLYRINVIYYLINVEALMLILWLQLNMEK